MKAYFAPKSKKVFFTLAALLLVAPGCGSDGDSDDNEIARVVDLDFAEPAVGVAQSVGLDVNFSFASETVQRDDSNVIIKIAVPDGLAYVPDSGKVDKPNNDQGVDPERIESCSDGSTIVTFDLDQSDLNNVDDPSGDADGKLRIDLVGTSAVGMVSLGARAGYDAVSGSCAAGFVPENIASIRVGL